ncbi:hypothetical protein CsatB_019972 [Cannabis sativa]|uniref:uncharacterized protein LOC115701183 n=1 Tax=Cannabis sativa TaxID=3483 RepID=UPI0029C9DDE2|nr:uncharacterized protein LOC115701183 [Cannabis sativa]
MELVIMALITLSCIFLSAFLTPCASLPIIHTQSSHKQEQAPLVHVHALMPLPWKLGFPTEEVNAMVIGRRAILSASMSNNNRRKQKENFSGKGVKNKVVRHRSRGTWREWVEGSDTSGDYFTMDYTRVRRRRPIHNKSIPVIRP